MSEATIVIMTGVAVALGIFMANWMERGQRSSPAALPPTEPQTVDEYVRRNYANIAY